jgi:hypothetical protein
MAPSFLTLALDRDKWSALNPSHFIPWERAHSNHWTGGWVGPRADLDAVEWRKTLAHLKLNPSHSTHKAEKKTSHLFPIFTKYFKIPLMFACNHVLLRQMKTVGTKWSQCKYSYIC